MKGRFRQGWFRYPDSASPGLILKVSGPVGPGLGFVATPFDRERFSHPIGAGGRLDRATWRGLVEAEAPSWSDGSEFDPPED